MPTVQVDDEVFQYLSRFPDVDVNKAIRLMLGLDRDSEHEHSSEDFRDPIQRVLREASGSLPTTQVYERAEQLVRLGPGDFRGAEPHWQNRMRYMADKLRKEGIIKRGSPKGLWELESL